MKTIEIFISPNTCRGWNRREKLVTPGNLVDSTDYKDKELHKSHFSFLDGIIVQR